MGFDAIFALIGKVIDFLPNKSKDQAAQLAAELQQAQIEANLAIEQIKVNAVEAANPSTFVSGARPFMMWVCGMAFAWMYVAAPILTWFVVLCGHSPPVLPLLDMSQLTSLLVGMLGLSGYRTYEKVKGVSK